jgi:hypothetical protein
MVTREHLPLLRRGGIPDVVNVRDLFGLEKLICPTTGNSRMEAMRELPVVPTCRTYQRLCRRANHKHISAHPASVRGALRDRYERWGGMRWTRQRRARGRITGRFSVSGRSAQDERR